MRLKVKNFDIKSEIKGKFGRKKHYFDGDML
jgi:hypothetical protein